MKLPKLPRFFSSKSRVLIPALLLLVVISISGYYYYKKQKSSADLQFKKQSFDITGAIQPRLGVYASACSDPIECQGVTEFYLYFQNNPIRAISDEASFWLSDLAEGCVKEIFSEDSSPSTIPPQGEINSENCQGSYQKHDEVFTAEVNVESEGTNLTGTHGEFFSVYNDKKNNNTGHEKIDISYTASMKLNYSITYDQEWSNSTVWYFEDNMVNFTGQVNSPFIMDMDSSENLSDNFKDWNELHPELQINIENSSWEAESFGKVNGEIAGTWNFDENPPTNDQIEITKFDLCPDTCQVTLQEDLDIRAIKTPNSEDSSQGIITKTEHHKVDYTGTGQGIPKEGKVVWTNLKMEQTDMRALDNDLTYPNGQVHFVNSNNSQSQEDKIAKTSRAQSTVIKDVTYPIMMPGQAPPGVTSNHVLANIEEENTNGQVARTGTGSQNLGGSSVEGIFDNQSSSEMLITSPESQGGQRINPFAPVPSSYLKDYFPSGTISVPGFFSASEYQGITTIKTKKAKSIPKKIYVFHSYDTNPRDEAFPEVVIKRINSAINSLKLKRSEIISKTTNTKPLMLKAFGEIENGSWVINIGHGSTIGLAAGSAKDGEFDKDHLVTDDEIRKILKEKQITIDIFAGYTCYAGRRESLAQQVIGGLGVSDAGPESIFTSIGIGGRSWTLSIEDITQALKAASGCKK